jgi:hypothetical protein
MLKSHLTRFVPVVVAAALLAGISATSTSAASNSTKVWYWSEQLVADALYANGIDWPRIRRHDPVSGDTCWGVGYRVANAASLAHYRYFWCEVRPRSGRPYNVVVDVVAQRQYSVNFGGYTQTHRWYWTAKYAADALYYNGIRWGNIVDPVTADYCTPFGRSLNSNGWLYYKHFFCAVQSTARRPYFVVVDVDSRQSYSVYWVDYDVNPRVAPSAPSSSSVSRPAAGSSDDGHTVTVGGGYDPGNGVTVIPPGGSTTSNGNIGYTFTFGGGLGPALTLAAQLEQTNPGGAAQVAGAVTAASNAANRTAGIWAQPTFCEDPFSGRIFSC